MMKSVLIMLGFYNFQMVELFKCRNKLCYQHYVTERIVFHLINVKNDFASRAIGALHQPIIKIKNLQI